MEEAFDAFDSAALVEVSHDCGIIANMTDTTLDECKRANTFSDCINDKYTAVARRLEVQKLWDDNNLNSNNKTVEITTRKDNQRGIDEDDDKEEEEDEDE